jgi:hypothetical protein
MRVNRAYRSRLVFSDVCGGGACGGALFLALRPRKVHFLPNKTAQQHNLFYLLFLI